MTETYAVYIEYYDENWERCETVAEVTPAINELIKEMGGGRNESK